MENKHIICCPTCSGELEKEWNETPSYIPDIEKQRCKIHGIVSSYQWGSGSIKAVDVRSREIIKKYPRLYKIDNKQLSYMYSNEIKNMLKMEPECIDWDNETIYKKCHFFDIPLSKKHKELINYEMANKFSINIFMSFIGLLFFNIKKFILS